MPTDVPDLVGHDGPDLSARERLQQRVGEQDIAQPAEHTHDGGVEHGAVGLPHEQSPHLDLMGAADGQQIVVDGAVGHGDDAQNPPGHQRGKHEHREAGGQGA